jgi:hypothetical protein
MTWKLRRLVWRGDHFDIERQRGIYFLHQRIKVGGSMCRCSGSRSFVFKYLCGIGGGE